MRSLPFVSLKYEEKGQKKYDIKDIYIYISFKHCVQDIEKLAEPMPSPSYMLEGGRRGNILIYMLHSFQWRRKLLLNNNTE